MVLVFQSILDKFLFYVFKKRAIKDIFVFIFNASSHIHIESNYVTVHIISLFSKRIVFAYFRIIKTVGTHIFWFRK